MKTIVFYREEHNVWRCNDNIQLEEQKNKQQWIIIMNNKRQICDSIYEVLNVLSKIDLHATFRIPEEMENIPSKCS